MHACMHARMHAYVYWVFFLLLRYCVYLFRYDLQKITSDEHLTARFSSPRLLSSVSASSLCLIFLLASAAPACMQSLPESSKPSCCSSSTGSCIVLLLLLLLLQLRQPQQQQQILHLRVRGVLFMCLFCYCLLR